ncbi:MAG: putative molybdenum carrier protein [Deltaproteobacteria bacterium]|nr:putative molybdenum carrier protein [Deltaproteobacteria bacterium]
MSSIRRILSGGQTGVDRAALDVARALGIPCGGWCPKGRLAEDGVIPSAYPLMETPSAEYAQRTEWNARDADGTLVLTYGAPSGGTAYTIACARRLGKPCLVMDLRASPDPAAFQRWCAAHAIAVLNVAGPRESRAPGEIGRSAKRVLEPLLKKVVRSS